ncbi:conserved protein of unknown function [Pseudomonas marincola]|uniref:Uncharacterized protein n=1 Tax=Pseudomonas marincola TaxID=437900 RepID=A0A653E9E5_9PSED|nr:conserved protein of unknown function [Pseudomonas marincola]
MNARSPTLTVETAAVDYRAKLKAKISLKKNSGLPGQP